MTCFFDDSTIQWQTLSGFEHLQYSILDIDRVAGIITVMFKFAARQQIVLHRHKVLNKTLVVQGEHRLYRADGSLRESRATGTYTVSPPGEEPHLEGGGAIDAVVLFAIHGDGLLYEILDDGMNVVATLNAEDFVELYRNQTQSAMPA